jgi:hypothetical protein
MPIAERQIYRCVEMGVYLNKENNEKVPQDSDEIHN